jgi:hypothetical protein
MFTKLLVKLQLVNFDGDKSDGQLGTQTQVKKCVLTISVWAVSHFCLLIYFLFSGRNFHNMGVYLDFI